MADYIEVQVPWMRYEVTMPLMQGRVPIEGVKLVPSLSAPGGTTFPANSPVPSGDFGLLDMNWANLLPAIEAGWEVIGLPVFSKRKLPFTYLFCRTDSGMEAARDLEGRPVLSSLGGSAVAMWAKGILQHLYGVDIESITWVLRGEERWPVHNPRWKFADLSSRKDNYDALIDGDVDAVMTDISDGALSEKLENDSRLRRLYPNYPEQERHVFDQLGFYPPVHIVAMSAKLNREHPDLAGKLFAAFEKSKELAHADVLNDRSSFAVLSLRERYLEQLKTWGDLFPHGLTANKPAIDMFVSLNYEHGAVKNQYGYEDMFAAGTLDT
ncbi:MAG TPA: hypothetical protein VGK54_08585 [Chloroflexota bacterium]